MAAAANDMVLTEAFLRTLALIDSPRRLLRPSMLMRVIKGNRRRTVYDGQDPPSSPRG
jgi:hypothetical protein